MPLSLFGGYHVRNEELRLLPSGHSPFSILHISDLHMVKGDRRQQKWLASLHHLQPDFVIGTGDYLGGKELDPLFSALEHLFAIPGAFVLGSNDYYAPSFKSPHRYLLKDSRTSLKEQLPTEALTQEFSKHWSNLTHIKTTLSIKGTKVELRGTDDAHLERDDYAHVRGKAAAELSIGVTHAPYRRILDAMENDGVDLVFAGHTHGGQWCLPGGRALVTNCDLPARFARGIHRHGRTTVEICAGSGTSPYAPLRLFCPPEAALITLLPK